MLTSVDVYGRPQRKTDNNSYGPHFFEVIKYWATYDEKLQFDDRVSKLAIGSDKRRPLHA